MNKALFAAADFLARPPGFYAVIVVMMLLAGAAYVGNVNVVNFALSEAAIIVTGIVLLQGARDTAALHVKMDAVIAALDKAPNKLVGLERAEPAQIEWQRAEVERAARNA